eukprot:CAMPEP_0206155114 /NCGR_PEP_ID=MMETSP1474-20131121/1894_1 /ASSEMBLY_ACC=CAM_ASM_001110 /TAXON_ID=97495 /ORGANISM="Imantonia sp., Strain RCC918" /LENGTH=470 /DNA_ID=CAMNT_0053553643 /DNA_START=221 /DNA_END=1634 /DNA_ORIENTATION=+
MTLYPKEEILNRNCRFLQGPHTNKETVRRIREAVDCPTAIEVEILNYRKDGVAFWNNFLMLPVFKGKKCRYFIAIQKNITTFKKGNNPEKWSAEEVAMWLEHYGISSFSKKIIEKDITGSKFLELNSSKVFKYGFILRGDQEDILSACKYLKEHIDAPFAKNNDPKPKNVYAPELLSESVNYGVNLNAPAELQYWERDDAPNDTILFKAYFRDKIHMFLWPIKTVSLEIVENQICSHFDIKNARLTHIDLEGKVTSSIYTNDKFNDIIENEKGTVKFYVEEEEKDLLSLTSMLYKVPDPIIVVNGLLHVLFSNEIANSMLGVTNASFLSNATQLLPELPIDFPKYPHLKTILMSPNGEIPVDVTITVHKETVFMLIIRPIGFTSKAETTESYNILVNKNRKQSCQHNSAEDEKNVEEDEKDTDEDADNEEFLDDTIDDTKKTETSDNVETTSSEISVIDKTISKKEIENN